MDSIGIEFKDVTHALLSHSHIDHIGGLAGGGEILFPNAASPRPQGGGRLLARQEPDFSKLAPHRPRTSRA
jgi:glyoxylase-like metal-dependent hydrolase (beta-lactamase superfamily II)